MIVRGSLNKAEEFADVISVGDEIDIVEAEIRVLDQGGAKERFKRGRGTASGVLVDVNGPRIGLETGSRRRGIPKGRRTLGSWLLEEKDFKLI